MCGEPGKRIGRTPGIRDRTARCDAGHGEATDQALQHHGFAAMEMIGAGRVDDDAARGIGSDDGRVAQQPDGEPIERLGVAGEVGVLHDEAGHQDLRLGDGHAGAKTGG